MATRAADDVAKDRRAEIYHHPITIVRAALDPAAKLANPRTQDNQSVVDITTANGLAFTLAIDSGTKLPTRVVSMTDNTNLGDVAVETTFADYQDVSGLKMPVRLTTKTDKYLTAELNVSKQTVDGDAGDLAAPAAAASAAAPVTPPAMITVTEAAPGIWWLAGQSHHSVLVEFADHMTIIEVAAERYARARRHREGARDQAGQAADARGGQPPSLRSFGRNSRGGFGRTDVDHADGERAVFPGRGRRAHTIVPDALAKNPKPVKIETVDEELELKDATQNGQSLPHRRQSARRHAADGVFPEGTDHRRGRCLQSRRDRHSVCAEFPGERHEAQAADRSDSCRCTA